MNYLIQGSTTPIAVPWLAIVALIITLLSHTAALFYWGGKIAQMLRDHERRLEDQDRRISVLEKIPFIGAERRQDSERRGS